MKLATVLNNEEMAELQGSILQNFVSAQTSNASIFIRKFWSNFRPKTTFLLFLSLIDDKSWILNCFSNLSLIK
jgi:hypothetical protein